MSNPPKIIRSVPAVCQARKAPDARASAIRSNRSLERMHAQVGPDRSLGCSASAIACGGPHIRRCGSARTCGVRNRIVRWRTIVDKVSVASRRALASIRTTLPWRVRPATAVVADEVRSPASSWLMLDLCGAPAGSGIGRSLCRANMKVTGVRRTGMPDHRRHDRLGASPSELAPTRNRTRGLHPTRTRTTPPCRPIPRPCRVPRISVPR